MFTLAGYTSDDDDDGNDQKEKEEEEPLPLDGPSSILPPSTFSLSSSYQDSDSDSDSDSEGEETVEKTNGSSNSHQTPQNGQQEINQPEIADTTILKPTSLLKYAEEISSLKGEKGRIVLDEDQGEFSISSPASKALMQMGLQWINQAIEDGEQLPEDQIIPISDIILQKIRHFVRLRRLEGRTLNQELEKKTIFRNPTIIAKLAKTMEISEYGTCLPTDLYNPGRLSDDDKFPSIGKWKKYTSRSFLPEVVDK